MNRFESATRRLMPDVPPTGLTDAELESLNLLLEKVRNNRDLIAASHIAGAAQACLNGIIQDNAKDEIHARKVAERQAA